MFWFSQAQTVWQSLRDLTEAQMSWWLFQWLRWIRIYFKLLSVWLFPGVHIYLERNEGSQWDFNKNCSDLQGPVQCLEKREKRSGSNFPLVLSVRDKASQQKLWKLRSGWEERNKKRRVTQTIHRGTFVFSSPQKKWAALIKVFVIISNAVQFVWILHLSAFISILT